MKKKSLSKIGKRRQYIKDAIEFYESYRHLRLYTVEKIQRTWLLYPAGGGLCVGTVDKFDDDVVRLL